MNEGIHKKIEATLSSLDGLQRAEASPYLYSKVRTHLQENKDVIPQGLAWRMVVALVIVAVVNIVTITRAGQKKEHPSEGASMIANEYAISLPQTYCYE